VPWWRWPERLGKRLNQLTLAEMRSVERKFGADVLEAFESEAGRWPGAGSRERQDTGGREAIGEVEACNVKRDA